MPATLTPNLGLNKPARTDMVSVVQDINDNMDRIDTAVAESVAPAYDSTATYNVDDMCFHNGGVYKCITTIATAEAWTPSHWEPVSSVVAKNYKGIEVLRDDIAPVIKGNRCAVGASSGDYVLLRNSTINGKPDGAYQAAQAIPADTPIDETYLGNELSGGIANSLNGKLSNKIQRVQCKFIYYSSNTWELDSSIAQSVQYVLMSDSADYMLVGATSGRFRIYKINSTSSFTTCTSSDGTPTFYCICVMKDSAL